MSKIRFLSLSFALMALLLVNERTALSQQYQSSPTDWVLEVTYYGGRPPAYQPVPAQGAKLNGSWYALFGHLDAWQPPAGFLPVHAVNILSRQEGDAVRVQVSAFVGAKNFEKEEAVATYLLHENEKVTTSGLTNFGVAPFEIKLSKVFPVPSNLPRILNKTQSIVVSNVEINNTTLASYKLLVRNLSGKNVAALGINVFVDSRRRMGSMPQGKEGQALIAANSDAELRVLGANNAHRAANGYMPDAPENQEIRINTVIFEDGSYEGDVEAAINYRGFTIGREIQMGRVVQLIKSILKELEASASTPRALENFKAGLASLGVEAEQKDVDRLRQEFPNLDGKAQADLITPIEVSLGSVKFDLTRSLQKLESARSEPLDADVLRVWLNQTMESYLKWLHNKISK